MSKTNRGLLRFIGFAMVLLIVVGLSLSGLKASGASPNLLSLRESKLDSGRGKIERALKDDYKDKETLEAIVYLKDQLDSEKLAYKTRKALSKNMSQSNINLEIRRAVVDGLKDKAQSTQENIIEFLEIEKDRGRVEDFTSYFVANVIYVKANREVIENIASRPQVEKILKNKELTLEDPIISKEIGLSDVNLEWNIEKVRANKVWDLGIDGRGSVIGILDSGVDWTHPALKDKWRGYNCETGEIDPDGNWFDPVFNAPLPEDSNSHGSHVIGTALGQEPDGRNKIGVAPGAKWIGARVFNEAGSTSEQILLAAAQWMMAPGGNPDMAPDVVNNSWGGLNGIDNWYRDVVRNWRAGEVFPVFSAGNQRQGEPSPWPGSISIPGNYPESFAVGATDINDRLASFSKLGPSPYDPSLIKPEICAPGVNIRSSIPGGGYTGTYSGTSMSAPHISGVVALLKSANETLSVAEIEETLTVTARPLTDSTYPHSPNFAYGYGLVDAYEAVLNATCGTGHLGGRVIETTPEKTPIANAIVTILETGKCVKTNPISGEYTMDHIANREGESFTLKVEAYGYYPKEIQVHILRNEVTTLDISLRPIKNFQEDEIIYDDGVGENALVLNDGGNGLAVRFTPDEFVKVKGANIYLWTTSWPDPGGTRLGFIIYGIDENGITNMVGQPIFLDNLVRGGWNYIDLSSYDFSTNRDFYISTIQDRQGTYCPGAGIDYSAPAYRSYMNIGGDFKLIGSEDIQGGIMIRAVIEKAQSDIDLEPEIERLFSGNRYATAVEISKKAYDRADTVVLVSGQSFPDALAATPLASLYQAPILLTEKDQVASYVIEEIERLGASKLILLGGHMVISKEVEDQLRDYEIERISGGNRNVTGVNIGERLILEGSNKSVVLVNGYDFPDGLSVGSPAAIEKKPIVFTQGTSLPDETMAALERWGIEEITIVGGPLVVSREIEDQLKDLGYEVDRISGGSRYTTALELAKNFFQTPDTVLLASGENFPDALAGGPLAGKLYGPILLVEKDEVRQEILAYLRDKRPKSIIVLGGDLVISDKVIRDIENIIK